MTALPERLRHIAWHAEKAMRVSNDMIARSEAPDGSNRPTITVAMDEYIQISMTMCNLSGIARELYALLAHVPSLDELQSLANELDTMRRGANMAADALSLTMDRMRQEPVVGDDEG